MDDDNSITKEMIEAGIKAWREWDDGEDYEVANLVVAVFLAMKKAGAFAENRQD